MKVIIINYGAGNIQSIRFAFERLGVHAGLSSDPEVISKADRVIFPGVGEASSAMHKLKQSGLETLIPELRQPVLGICLGMQLMCHHSEEGNTPGLSIFDEEVIRFGPGLKVPQIGWNKIEKLKSPLFKGVQEGAFVYMVHSYYAAAGTDTIASSTYELEYSAALARDNFYGVQFHPEKSSKAGARILRNFLELK
ncbi:imidazole glycerol phosphate synthase subunit HisH [Robiginitalea sp. IMCC44478]|uniref:imidazole glycerol phosphate synthase subunit HisH n=1 Tax=Robiginitalea sp. IMCC44478 TaxID=3459122 RepID=UPI0040435E1C